uniref:Predicted nucleic acid-binding protein, contains PIN domain n=1 Tax=Candidatus Kentrum sp. LPFa TaxID=2126335 RepID=A0A450XG69_9GAMM|nr:MAG: Predicted nucleic acid-binding protein, contains PIN domain [Candidatus Kentron sp. LPFa]VFK28249.1 MAG: Predicted nucleic acid-binding protein, contains PIN domain [Candidatus Kentron sp. LPFa]
MNRKQIYWDSDCFLGYLKSEPDKEDLCGRILEEADAGRVLLVTSALTIAEVLNLKGKQRIPKESREGVINLFRNDYIAVRNVTRRVAEFAREYVWNDGIKPKDAIHVATALDARLTLLNTFDEGLLKKSGRLGDSEKLIISRPKPPPAQALFEFSENT